MNEVTRILSAIEQGDPTPPASCCRWSTTSCAAGGPEAGPGEPGQTLQATALVHEAYLRLVGRRQGQHWDHRGHFFAAAAEAMRRILVENARRKQASSTAAAGSACPRGCTASRESPDDLLALDEALTRFAGEEPAKAELVKLRFFAGLSMPRSCQLPWEFPWQPPSAGGPLPRTWLYHAGPARSSKKNLTIREGVRSGFSHCK